MSRFERDLKDVLNVPVLDSDVDTKPLFQVVVKTDWMTEGKMATFEPEGLRFYRLYNHQNWGIALLSDESGDGVKVILAPDFLITKHIRVPFGGYVALFKVAQGQVQSYVVGLDEVTRVDNITVYVPDGSDLNGKRTSDKVEVMQPVDTEVIERVPASLYFAGAHGDTLIVAPQVPVKLRTSMFDAIDVMYVDHPLTIVYPAGREKGIAMVFEGLDEEVQRNADIGFDETLGMLFYRIGELTASEYARRFGPIDQLKDKTPEERGVIYDDMVRIQSGTGGVSRVLKGSRQSAASAMDVAEEVEAAPAPARRTRARKQGLEEAQTTLNKTLQSTREVSARAQTRVQTDRNEINALQNRVAALQQEKELLEAEVRKKGADPMTTEALAQATRELTELEQRFIGLVVEWTGEVGKINADLQTALA